MTENFRHRSTETIGHICQADNFAGRFCYRVLFCGVATTQ